MVRELPDLQRRRFTQWAAAAALPVSHGLAAAEWKPSKPLTWVVPYPTGGFGDAMSRLLAQQLSNTLKQAVIVENRPGGAAQIAAAYMKQLPADGHALFYGDLGPFAMYPSLYPRLSYAIPRDFTPVTRLFNTPVLLVVPASSKVSNLAELVRSAKAGDGLSYGSYGIGSQPHVWTEQFGRLTGGRFNHVPYQGAGPALQDVIGGRLDFMVDVIASSLPLVRDGRLKALAVVGSPRRSELLPTVPTLTESGYPSLDQPGWNGVVMRAGTPFAALGVIQQHLASAVHSQEVTARYAPLGLQAAAMPPDAFAAFVESETRRWGAAIREAKVSIE